ncbi:MAG: stage III sporulation protein AF [Bacillota bacterium]|uniref:stage III sporulation protein AF n=1 Tax=Bacillus sp. RO2 TaxID=2723913 RepID=UPI00145E1597|nr:stage III sporulation protein AF [Bacillus sp. RO2]MEA3320715.1 stage III sporulation protein AF [Bacillota bacterium]NMH74308.1 stage III sporulation protein AF [Bacillus sp. RO2]
MSYLTEWITSIILFILLATVVEMLLPNSSMQKYTKLVIGLLLIVVILTPILKLLSTDMDELFAKMTTHSSYTSKENTENLIEMKKKEIQASHAAYILNKAAVLMKEDVEEELRESYGVTVKDLRVVVKNEDQLTELPIEENIESVVILLEQAEDETAIQVVKPVQIDTSRQKEPAPSSKEEGKIANFLADRWQLQPTNISVAVEGGD